jgi:multimeric flavodoxin WrbA
MYPMKVLGIIGSPRKKESVSTRLLGAMLEVFGEAGWTPEVRDVTTAGLRDCNGCNACAATGRCVVEDGLQEIYDRVLECRVLIVASPVYFRAPGAAVKRFVDRCQGFWFRRFRLLDPAFLARPAIPCAVIAVAGGPSVPRLFGATEIVLRSFCMTMGFAYVPGLFLSDTETLTEERSVKLLAEARERALALMAAAERVVPL